MKEIVFVTSNKGKIASAKENLKEESCIKKFGIWNRGKNI